MKALASALLLALLLQDGELAREAARALGKDPAAALDAASRLVDLPPSAELDAALAAWPAEAAFLRDTVKAELAAKKVLGDRFGAVRRVDLDVDARPLPAVLQAVADSLKIRLDTSNAFPGAEPPAVTIKAKGLTPLEALDRVLREGKLCAWPAEDTLRVQPGVSDFHPSSSWRNFLLRVQSVRRGRILELGGPAREVAQIQLQGWCDGAVAPAGGWSWQAVLDEAVDDLGRPWKAGPPIDPPADPGTYLNATGAGFAAMIDLAPPDAKSAKLSRLRGWVRTRIPTRSLRFDLPIDGGKPARLEVGGHVLEWKGRVIRHGSPCWEFVVTAPKETADALATMPVDCAATETAGTPVARGVGVEARPGGAVAYTFSSFEGYFDDEPEHAAAQPVTRLVFNLHVETVERRIPFEFRDLPLK